MRAETKSKKAKQQKPNSKKNQRRKVYYVSVPPAEPTSGHTGGTFAKVETILLRSAALFSVLIAVIRVSCHDLHSLSDDLAALWKLIVGIFTV